MEKLLNWSLAQQDPETAAKVGTPDPKLLAQLFGKNGPDDPTLMKQSIQIIENPEITDKEVKLSAFDNYEMLIENLDNANNIENLKHWESIINQLDSKEKEFVEFSASIIGTAVQNNQPAQQAFLKYADLAFPKLIKLGSEGNAKSLFALSNLIRNNDESFKKFNENKGWSLLSPIIKSQYNSKVKLKSLSLLSSLLSLTYKKQIFSHIKENEIVKEILELINKDSEVNIIDRSLNLMVSLISNGYEFNDTEKKNISNAITVLDNNFLDVINLNELKTLKQVK